MKFVVLLAVVLVIVIFIIKQVMAKIKRKKVIEAVENYPKKSNLDYELKVLKNNIFDIDLKVSNKHYYIKILLVPSYS